MFWFWVGGWVGWHWGGGVRQNPPPPPPWISTSLLLTSGACPLPPSPQVGEYSIAGQEDCTPCPAGYICPFQTSNVMEKCKNGTYTFEGEEVTECNVCPVGHACPVTNPATGASPSSACPTGSYAAAGSQSCTTCPAGFYCPDPTQPDPMYVVRRPSSATFGGGGQGRIRMAVHHRRRGVTPPLPPRPKSQPWMHLVNGTGQQPVSGTADPRSSQTGQVIRGLR